MKSRVYNSFLNHATEGAYSFVERFSLWKSTLGKIKTLWFLVQCLLGLFSFLKLLLSFKINDKKEFKNKAFVSLPSTACLRLLEAIPRVN